MLVRDFSRGQGSYQGPDVYQSGQAIDGVGGASITMDYRVFGQILVQPKPHLDDAAGQGQKLPIERPNKCRQNVYDQGKNRVATDARTHHRTNDRQSPAKSRGKNSVVHSESLVWRQEIVHLWNRKLRGGRRGEASINVQFWSHFYPCEAPRRERRILLDSYDRFPKSHCRPCGRRSSTTTRPLPRHTVDRRRFPMTKAPTLFLNRTKQTNRRRCVCVYGGR
mmetsp:Transcript_14782/g.30509  ORF Transcript_14782/g.30509 Transcript_14782/m.30509 type:complete len:222 (-) Transcript_14782:1335-2000(-)